MSEFSHQRSDELEDAAEEAVAEETPAEVKPETDKPAAEEAVAEEKADDTELTEIEDYETPLGLPEMEEPKPEKKVMIFTTQNGNTVNLTSKLEGLDGYKVSYQWQCDKHDGAGFQDVSGANESTYSFSATSENLEWEWRLSVYFG